MKHPGLVNCLAKHGETGMTNTSTNTFFPPQTHLHPSAPPCTGLAWRVFHSTDYLQTQKKFIYSRQLRPSGFTLCFCCTKGHGQGGASPLSQLPFFVSWIWARKRSWEVITKKTPLFRLSKIKFRKYWSGLAEELLSSFLILSGYVSNVKTLNKEFGSSLCVK